MPGITCLKLYTFVTCWNSATCSREIHMMSWRGIGHTVTILYVFMSSVSSVGCVMTNTSDGYT